METIYLSRRNLLNLLEKLDHVKQGGSSYCGIIKGDTKHPTHPASTGPVWVFAVEDENYYTDREPGVMMNMKTGDRQ